ncbi:MAG: hypothetical protein M5U07_05545 [Xanthobacteraceae bacterium]|nr:hypothetical protein [Xanthobacteraceae bacterium]
MNRLHHRPHADPRRLQARRGGVVEQHDGTVIALKKIAPDYDPSPPWTT